jgi:hypothetical protein
MYLATTIRAVRICSTACCSKLPYSSWFILSISCFIRLLVLVFNSPLNAFCKTDFLSSSKSFIFFSVQSCHFGLLGFISSVSLRFLFSTSETLLLLPIISTKSLFLKEFSCILYFMTSMGAGFHKEYLRGKQLLTHYKDRGFCEFILEVGLVEKVLCTPVGYFPLNNLESKFSGLGHIESNPFSYGRMAFALP